MSEKDKKEPVKKSTPASKTKKVSVKDEPVVEEVKVEETVTNEVNNNVGNGSNNETKILWIIIAILGGILTFIGLFTGMKIIGEGIKNAVYNKQPGISQEHHRMMEDIYNQGYNDGYNQGYNDGMYSGQVPMYEDPCSYDYMLEYGYQPDCVYVPENETMTPDDWGMMQDGMPNREMTEPSMPNNMIVPNP